MRPVFLSASLLVLAAGLAGCNSTPPAPAAVASRAALPTMERVARGANDCWFKSGDKAFAPYRMALELNSFSGKPRILLVKKHSPETRPLLVVQAEGNPARLDAFGPMMSDAHSGRISSDVTRWANGASGC
jgi:hypothetical protein